MKILEYAKEKITTQKFSTKRWVFFLITNDLSSTTNKVEIKRVITAKHTVKIEKVKYAKNILKMEIQGSQRCE